MKVTLNIDPNLPDDQASFQLRKMTPQLEAIIKQLQNLDFRLIGSLDEKKYRLDFAEITTIYAADKKVFAATDDQQEYSLSETLTVLSEKLPHNFLRISHSEIVNADKIKYFDFTFAGKIKISFRNGQHSYSSRSYLKQIKEYFGL